jgi:hypothetical protein
MSKLLDHYLDRVLAYANRPEPEARAIRAELKDHLLQKIEDLTAGGMGREDAAMEALRQHGNPRMIGYKLRPAFPWVDIRSRGTARGVIAIGPRAVGIFAFGGVAIGVVASGGFSCGLISAGGFAFGLLFAWAGFACGGIAIGGFSAGLVAWGGIAAGLLAEGGQAYGLWVPNADRAVSYFAGKNVPDWLRGLKPLLGVGQFLGRHFIGFTISYVAVVFSLSALQRREELRLRKGEDWLLED